MKNTRVVVKKKITPKSVTYGDLHVGDFFWQPGHDCLWIKSNEYNTAVDVLDGFRGAMPDSEVVILIPNITIQTDEDLE